MSEPIYIDLTPARENVFDIDEADGYACEVNQYLQGRTSMMWIRANKEPWGGKHPVINLVFMEVIFFDGPTFWGSAKYRLESTETFFELADKLSGIKDAPKDISDAFLKRYHLFTVSTNQYTIRIVASSAYKTNSIPQHFKSHSQ